MKSTDKQEIIREMMKYTGGAGVITVTQFMRFIGMKSREKAKKKLAGLPAFEGKYYLLDDVADLWLRELVA